MPEAILSDVGSSQRCFLLSVNALGTADGFGYTDDTIQQIEGYPMMEDAGGMMTVTGSITWKSLPKDAQRLVMCMRVAEKSDRYFRRTHPAVPSTNNTLEPTQEDTLERHLTAFAKEIHATGFTRPVFTKACEDLKEYYGHIFTLSQSGYGRGTIKYNTVKNQRYAPNPPRTWPQRKTRHTGYKKGLAEKQFHMRGSFTEDHIDFIFDKVSDNIHTSQMHSNSYALEGMKASCKKLRDSTRRLLEGINIEQDREPTGEYFDADQFFHSSVAPVKQGMHQLENRVRKFKSMSAVMREKISADLRNIISRNINHFLIGGRGVPYSNRRTIQAIQNLRMTPTDSWSTNGLSNPSNTEFISVLEFWCDHTIEDCRPLNHDKKMPTSHCIKSHLHRTSNHHSNNNFVHTIPFPQIMTPADHTRTQREMEAIRDEANTYTRILRVIFESYKAEIKIYQDRVCVPLHLRVDDILEEE